MTRPPGPKSGVEDPTADLEDGLATYEGDADESTMAGDERFPFHTDAPRPTDPQLDDAFERPTEAPPAPRRSSTEAEFAARYTVGPAVGVGGMAEVHLGYEKIDGTQARPCVIKRIVREYARHPAYLEMFTEEVRLSRLLSHPNVVEAYGDGEVEGAPYIVFELIDGVTLKDFEKLHGERLPPAVVVEIAIQVARGLAYAHSAAGEDGEPMKLVHRDISPQNILVSRDCQVKIVDFGIARFEGRMHATMSGEVKGKLKYMALEQVEEKPVDGRADLFALGIVMAELLCVLREGFTEHFVSGIEKQAGNVPRPLYDLLARLTAPHAANRPPSAEAAIGELMRVHKQLPNVTLASAAAKVFAKHRSVLEKAAAPATPKPGTWVEVQRPKPQPILPPAGSEWGSEFDEEVEQTVGYAELIAAGHMPVLPAGASISLPPVHAPSPLSEPPEERARPAARPAQRDLDLLVERARSAELPTAMDLPRAPADPRTSGVRPHPGFGPDMTGELSSRSAQQPIPPPAASKLTWALAAILALMAIALVTMLVSLKMDDPAPAPTPTERP